MTTTSNPDRFLARAKLCVVKALLTLGEQSVLEDDLYIVWFSKTLQNWKALVSTDAMTGTYFEVTHNGDKDETYVDTYSKVSNVVVPH